MIDLMAKTNEAGLKWGGEMGTEQLGHLTSSKSSASPNVGVIRIGGWQHPAAAEAAPEEAERIFGDIYYLNIGRALVRQFLLVQIDQF